MCMTRTSPLRLGSQASNRSERPARAGRVRPLKRNELLDDARRASSVEIDVGEPVARRARVGSLLVANPVGVAELVRDDVAQLGVIRSDRSDVDLHDA